MRPHAVALHALPPLLCCAIGCGGDVGSTSSQPRPTIVEVSPEDFLGGVPCLDAPGAARLYVARLTDVPPQDPSPEYENEGTLPSSGPVPCTSPVGFARVTPGHRYTAEVRLFDRADLVAGSPGEPELFDPETDDAVAPRWTTSCGGEEGTLAESRLTLRVRGCSEPALAGEPTPTGVSVNLADSLGELGCVGDGGAVDHYLVRRDGEELGRADCAETITLAELAPNELLTLELLAFAGAEDAEPSFGATCSARTLPGVTVSASCGPLASAGAIAIDLELALGAAGATCGSSLLELLLVLPDAQPPEIRLGAESCRGTARFTALAPGDYGVEVSAARQGAEAPGRAICAARVEPGLSALAECAPE